MKGKWEVCWFRRVIEERLVAATTAVLDENRFMSDWNMYIRHIVGGQYE